MPALVSQDGRWYWDGRQWRSRMVEGPLDLFWFTGTPDWEQRILVTGLIALIPIVGGINTVGWTLVATDMIRQRWKELPRAGFHYLERGVNPFVVSFVYGLIALFLIGILFIAGFVLIFSDRSLVALGVVLIVFSFLLLVAWWVISLFFFASVLIGSDRLGIGRAINPATLIRLARGNFDTSLNVGVTYGAGSIALGLAGLVIGFIVPFGGILISIALPVIYAMTVPRLATFEVPAAAPLPPAAPLDTSTA